MKTVMNCCLLLLAFFTLNCCQKKELELNLVETACKNFKLDTPSYEWMADPSCGSTSVKASLRISFHFNGDAECIDLIHISPAFYKADNSTIENVAFTSAMDKTDTLVTILTNSVTFIFQFEFEHPADADSLNHVYLKLLTQNELGNKSKNLEIRINTRCSTVSADTYSVIKQINVDTNLVEVNLRDDATEDGDIISIYLNGVWVLENYSLTNEGKTFSFPVKGGNNHLILFAVNEGKVGPNTVSLSINGTLINVSPDLLKGEAVNIIKF